MSETIKSGSAKTKVIKDFGAKTLSTLQKVGKSLVFPIAVMPAAALFLRIGDVIQVTGDQYGTMGEQAIYWIGFILKTPGAAVFNNLPIIFALGVGFGFSKDQRGEAAVVAGLSYFVISLMTQAEGSLTTLFYSTVNTVTYQGKEYSRLLYVIPESGGAVVSQPVWAINLGVFAGITAGLFSAKLYNRFSDTRLHPALAFFSGRRFTPMVVLGATSLLAFPLAALWPWIQYSLILMAQGMSSAPAASAGTYVFLNRLLIPFGLHQVLNTYFWFQNPIVTSVAIEVTDVAGVTFTLAAGTQLMFKNSAGEVVPILGDINAFMNGMSSVWVANGPGGMTELNTESSFDALQAAKVGMYQTGFFPVMMFGLPAVGLALAKVSDKEHRKSVYTFMITAAAVSFLTGITEPLEFSFMFLSPILYFCYALLSGIVAAITILTGASIGFGFSAGAIDFGLSIPISAQLSTGFASGWGGYRGITSVLGIGLMFAPVYYFMTYFIVKKFDLATPGRKGNIAGLTGAETIPTTKNGMSGEPKKDKNEKWRQMAINTIKLVKASNIKEIDNCITRVRLIVNDNTFVTDADAKSIGYLGLAKVGKNAIQLIIGAESEVIANIMREILPSKLEEEKQESLNKK